MDRTKKKITKLLKIPVCCKEMLQLTSPAVITGQVSQSKSLLRAALTSHPELREPSANSRSYLSIYFSELTAGFVAPSSHEYFMKWQQIIQFAFAASLSGAGTQPEITVCTLPNGRRTCDWGCTMGILICVSKADHSTEHWHINEWWYFNPICFQIQQRGKVTRRW